MEAYLLGILIIGTFFYLAFNQRRMLKEVSKESEGLKDNLNHVAAAIMGLSELLEEADQIVEDASRIPTMGEMMQQMLMGFIAQKFQPVIAPMENITNTINQVTPHGEVWQEKETSPEDQVVETAESI